MTDLPSEVLLILYGLGVAVVLTIIFAVKTHRYHGIGQSRLAPPAIPWLIASFGVMSLTFAYGIWWIFFS